MCSVFASLLPGIEPTTPDCSGCEVRGLHHCAATPSTLDRLCGTDVQSLISFHFVSIYLNRVKLQLYIHKLLYKLPCTKKKDKILKNLQYNLQNLIQTKVIKFFIFAIDSNSGLE